MPKSIPQAPEILRQLSTEGPKLVKLLPLIIITAILSAAISAGGVYWWLTSKVLEEGVKQPTQAESLPGEQSEGTQAATEALERLFEETLEGDYTGWEIYIDEAFGYAFMYPDFCRVEPEHVGVLMIRKVDTNGYGWGFVTVEQSSENSPSGMGILEWTLGELRREETYDGSYPRVISDYRIADLPTAHLIYEGSSIAPDGDGFRFIYEDHLFKIDITHTASTKDWNLYNKFLNSFTFF